MIDGFPGAVSFWVDEVNRTAMQTGDDLRREAASAHKLRYLEFDRLLKDPSVSQRTFAASCVFPASRCVRWLTFRQLLAGDLSDSAIDALIDDLIYLHVLDDAAYPTYGHDTRHAATRQWFIEHQRRQLGHIADNFVESLASRIMGATP